MASVSGRSQRHKVSAGLGQHTCCRAGLLTSVLGKLGVGQDLLAELESVSVLLVFVTSLSKERCRCVSGEQNLPEPEPNVQRRPSRSCLEGSEPERGDVAGINNTRDKKRLKIKTGHKRRSTQSHLAFNKPKRAKDNV